jgi:hypothetical protein
MAMAAALCVTTATALALAQTPAPQSTQAPITILGCVERTMTPGAKPGTPTQFRLIETGPAPATAAGRSTTKPPPAIEPQYLLTAPASIDLGKFQNQRVEVTGTVSLAPVPKPPATVPSDAPKSVLAAMAVRLINNECK